MELESDEALVERFIGMHDGGRALETLFRRHMDRVYRLSRRYFTIREDAEEAVSETFLRCFKALRDGQFRQQSLFKTWLSRITVNVCLERLRQPRLPTLLLEQISEMAGPQDKDDGLREAIGRLPDDQRLALILCDLEGYEAKEAAEIFGKSVSAVKSLHYRARRALRDILERDKREHHGV